MPRTVVIAPDSFKGSIRAAGAARALARGWRTADPRASIVERPMADGGEGTLDAFAAAVPGARRMSVRVTGPDGRATDAAWLLLPATPDAPGGAGVVELASTSGIELLGGRLLPWAAHTFGFGQAIAAALDHGVSRLVLGIGSSASTDGGAGLLAALGARFEGVGGGTSGDDRDTRSVGIRDERAGRTSGATGDGLGGVERAPLGAEGLPRIRAVDLTGLRALPPGGAVVLADVTNPLLGETGAVRVFGPQKGLDDAGVVRADAILRDYAALFPVDPGTPGAGAAGGAGFALLAWGARLLPGAAEVARLIGLREAVAAASVVVTGEGAYDGQSAAGKAPSFVARLAAAEGVPVALVAGRIDADADASAFAATVSLAALAGGSEPALADPARWLRAAGAALAARTEEP